MSNLKQRLSDAVTGHFADVMNLPDWVRTVALGRNIRPLGDAAAAAAFPVVQREVQEAYRRGRDEVLVAVEKWLASRRLFAVHVGMDGSRMPIPDPKENLRVHLGHTDKAVNRVRAKAFRDAARIVEGNGSEILDAATCKTLALTLREEATRLDGRY